MVCDSCCDACSQKMGCLFVDRGRKDGETQVLLSFKPKSRIQFYIEVRIAIEHAMNDSSIDTMDPQIQLLIQYSFQAADSAALTKGIKMLVKTDEGILRSLDAKSICPCFPGCGGYSERAHQLRCQRRSWRGAPYALVPWRHDYEWVVSATLQIWCLFGRVRPSACHPPISAGDSSSSFYYWGNAYCWLCTHQTSAWAMLPLVLHLSILDECLLVSAQQDFAFLYNCGTCWAWHKNL